MGYEMETFVNVRVANINSAFNLIHTLGFTECPGEENSNPLQYSCLENPRRTKSMRWQTVGHY